MSDRFDRLGGRPLNTVLHARELVSADRGRVLEGIAGLSPQSLFLRYGRAIRPTASDLAWLDALDGRAAVAYGACHRATGSPVGVARYVGDGSLGAEVAVTIADAWQGHGIGTWLLERLAAHATRAGFCTLSASIMVENRAAIALMRGIGGRAAAPPGWGILPMRATLGEDTPVLPARRSVTSA
jgi:protein lysine acetyltransferase